MRRRLTALTAALAAIALLAGCAGDGGSGTTGPDPLTEVLVSGEFGQAPTVDIGDLSGLGETPVRQVLIEGDGPEITAETTVDASMAVYDGGTKLEQVPYSSVGQLFTPGDEQLPAFFTDIFVGVPSGSRVVAVIPGSVMVEQSGGAAGAVSTPVAPAVVIADVSAVPPEAWGTEQPATQDLVTVTDGTNGPDVTIAPGATAPAELVLDVRKAGDGAVVQEGDTVTVQYRGVLFDTGAEFDSSWSRGAPTQFATDEVVPGFGQALVGQQVGSQVIAIIPSDLAYGDAGTQGIPGGAALVFVIDILGTKSA